MTSFKERALAHDQLPSILTDHVRNLEKLGADTEFHRFMANSTRACDFYWSDFYSTLFTQGSFPRRDSEIVRLRLAALSGCAFCRRHDVASALECGVTQEVIDALFSGDLSVLTEHERMLTQVAEAICAFTPVEPMSPELIEVLSASYTDQQISELLMITAVLSGVGAMLVAAGFVPLQCEIPQP